jgi:hypothetical protein
MDDLTRGKYGSLTMPSGIEFSGTWENDLRAGFGSLTYGDDMFFEGYWSNDKTSGDGLLIHFNKLRSNLEPDQSFPAAIRRLDVSDFHFQNYTKYKFCGNDVAWYTKSRDILASYFPERYLTAASGSFKGGVL